MMMMMTTMLCYHDDLRVYWELGGEMRAEREYAQAQFLEAAAEDGPWQAPGFEWLGHWYDQVAHDEPRARKCYQRALALDPTLVSCCRCISSKCSCVAASVVQVHKHSLSVVMPTT